MFRNKRSHFSGNLVTGETKLSQKTQMKVRLNYPYWQLNQYCTRSSVLMHKGFLHIDIEQIFPVALAKRVE